MYEEVFVELAVESRFTARPFIWLVAFRALPPTDVVYFKLRQGRFNTKRRSYFHASSPGEMITLKWHLEDVTDNKVCAGQISVGSRLLMETSLFQPQQALRPLLTSNLFLYCSANAIISFPNKIV